jgi:hypothetical protein
MTTVFTTANHPSDPAAHGCDMGAIGAMLSYLFPNDAEFYTAGANEAAESQFWAASISAQTSRRAWRWPQRGATGDRAAG